MQRTKRFHRTRALLAGTAVVAAALAGSAGTASAGTAQSDSLVFVPYNGQTFTIWRNGNVVQPVHFSTQQAIEGNFSGASGEDTFLYNPGSGKDGILHVTPSASTATTSFRSESISGTFTPVVGDFDGNAIDDILWYAPGSGADYLWLFQPNGTHTQVSLTINGSYRPTAVATDGDGYDDVIWYAPGSAADSIWHFGPGGSHTSSAVTIGGNYQLITGYFGIRPEGSPQKRVIFFDPAGPDSIWTFSAAGSHTSAGLPSIQGAAKPIVGSFTSQLTDNVLFYRSGSAAEDLIGFDTAGAVQQYEAPVVNGSYDPAVGDFDGNLYDDIAWTSFGKATLWKFASGGFSQATITTNTNNTIGITSRSGVEPV